MLFTPHDTFPPEAHEAYSLFTELRKQDPLDRIRFMRPAISDLEPFAILNYRSLVRLNISGTKATAAEGFGLY
jgi:hypothetical protein